MAIVVGKGDIKCTEPVGVVTRVVVDANQYHRNSNYYELSVVFSADGVTYENPGISDYSYTGSKPHFISTVNNTNENRNYFNIKTPWGTLTLYSFEIYFVSE